jgi:hypothetical protein
VNVTTNTVAAQISNDFESTLFRAALNGTADSSNWHACASLGHRVFERGSGSPK